MTVLPVIIAVDHVFKKGVEEVKDFDENLRKQVEDIKETMYFHNAVGIAGPMVGIHRRIAVVDVRDDLEKRNPTVMINPRITYSDQEMQVFEEASLCFPFISALVKRPRRVVVEYQDEEGRFEKLDASEYLATVIQHELDYLNGRVYLDHISATKKDFLLKKMTKLVKLRAKK